MLHKLAVFFIVVLITLLMVLTRLFAVYAQVGSTFQPLDRGFNYQFEYPMETHSVRTSNLLEPEGTQISFGALIAIEPNDSYLYAGGAQPTYLTRMRVLAGINADPVNDTGELGEYLGRSPLLRYDKASATVEQITLGGQPALRVDGIPVVPGHGATEIIVAFEGLVYQIVIEPVPMQLGFEANDPPELDPIYEGILNSWTFAIPAL